MEFSSEAHPIATENWELPQKVEQSLKHGHDFSWSSRISHFEKIGKEEWVDSVIDACEIVSLSLLSTKKEDPWYQASQELESPHGNSFAIHKNLPLRTLIVELVNRSRTSLQTLRLAMLYVVLVSTIQRGSKDYGSALRCCYVPSSPLKKAQCGRRVLLGALITAAKFLHDQSFSNRAWSRAYGLSTKEILKIECNFLYSLRWSLWIPQRVWNRWVALFSMLSDYTLLHRYTYVPAASWKMWDTVLNCCTASFGDYLTQDRLQKLSDQLQHAYLTLSTPSIRRHISVPLSSPTNEISQDSMLSVNNSSSHSAFSPTELCYSYDSFSSSENIVRKNFNQISESNKPSEVNLHHKFFFNSDHTIGTMNDIVLRNYLKNPLTPKWISKNQHHQNHTRILNRNINPALNAWKSSDEKETYNFWTHPPLQGSKDLTITEQRRLNRTKVAPIGRTSFPTQFADDRAYSTETFPDVSSVNSTSLRSFSSTFGL